jgi:hypothetical protein
MEKTGTVGKPSRIEWSEVSRQVNPLRRGDMSVYIDDTLLISCPNLDGGLVAVNGRCSTRLSARAVTGLFVGDSVLLCAYQDSGGNVVGHFSNNNFNTVLLSDSFMDLHDVYFSDGIIYMAVTDNNSVFSFDCNLNIISKWSLPGENDAVHLNSVVVYDEQLLASIFGRFKRNREYKDGTRGRGEVVNIRTGETYISGLSQPHSLTVVGDFLYLCSSEDKELRIYRKKELIHKINVNGYARGIAVSKNKIYVGISLSRNLIIPVESDKSCVVVIDNKSKKIDGFVPIESKEIYDIRLVNDFSWIFPHVVDIKYFCDQISRLEEQLALYKQGYESYKQGYESYKRLFDTQKPD